MPVNFKPRGNKDINDLIDLFKNKMKIKVLDGTINENRRYCYLAIKKFTLDGVKMIIEVASGDSFWHNKITSFKTLYYKGMQIASSVKEKSNLIEL